jgi:hypothetical protein
MPSLEEHEGWGNPPHRRLRKVLPETETSSALQLKSISTGEAGAYRYEFSLVAPTLYVHCVNTANALHLERK